MAFLSKLTGFFRRETMPDEPNFADPEAVEPAPEAPAPTPNPDPVVAPPVTPPVVEEPELTVAEPVPVPDVPPAAEEPAPVVVEEPAKPEPTVKVLAKLTTMSAEAVKELTEGFALAAKQSDVDAVKADLVALTEKCDTPAVVGIAPACADSVEQLSDYAFAVFTKSGYGLRWSFVTQADKSINVEVHIVLKS